ncbi:MAG: hypothetical protein EXS55_04225 [Candidatus Magasanikbacteria bacterium]|nr:hypothetical protein [Candidatus Magasanikbacteria bacterium]
MLVEEASPLPPFLLIGVTLLTIPCFFIPQLFVGVIGLIALALVLLLSEHLLFGWYVLVALSPLIKWELSFLPFHNWLQNYPGLYGMHAPLVEFWTVLLIVAFVINVARRVARGEKISLYWPGLPWFLLFVGSALVSLVPELSVERAVSLKYLAHFILLFYIGYVVLGANIIESKIVWHTSLKILAGVGLAGAVLGALSILTHFVLGDGFVRAAPLSLWGWRPFGGEHIFLAEVLTTTIPLWLYFWHQARNVETKRLAGLAAGFMFVIGLLTLSRAAWVTLASEAVIFFYLTHEHRSWRSLVEEWWWAFVVALPVFGYLIYFLITSTAAAGSTAARLSLTDIAFYLWREHPIVGQGVGTFVDKLADIKVFSLEFGAPLDAHGVVQKLLAEQGLLGLITFTIFIGWIIRTILARYRDKNYTDEARTAYFVSFFLVLSPLIFQLFNTQYYSSKMWVPISLAIAQAIIYRKETHWTKLEINFNAKRRRIVTEM